jgi:hypothetical protein
MSYFYEYKRPVSYINIRNSKPHLSYIEPTSKEDDLITKCNRNNYVREINKWLNNNLIHYEYYKKQDNINNDEDIINEENYTLKVKDICKEIYHDILEVVQESGFEINDLNQFKEDLIYYIYILSDIRQT